MPKIGEYDLEAGQMVEMLENNTIIDTGMLKEVITADSSKDGLFEVEFESRRLFPGKSERFVFLESRNKSESGWHLLSEDPMAGGQCFSQRGYFFLFRPI